MQPVPRPFAVSSVGLVLVTALLTAATTNVFSVENVLFVLFMALVAVVSENTAPEVGGYSVSLALPLSMGAMLLEGPLASAIIAGASTLKPGTFRSVRGLCLTSYNMSQLALASLAAGWVYHLLGGRFLTAGGMVVPLGQSDFPEALVPLVAASVVSAAGNMLITVFGVSLMYSTPVRDILPSASTYLPSMLALAWVGFLIGQVVSGSIFALILFVFPLAVAQGLYQRFKSLKDAYVDTIKSFVGALEAKDPYTRGHSERVSEYAVTIGAAMKLDGRSRERLEHAALLHDLGKISISRGILTKPGRLSDDEMAIMQEHPATGARMIEKVPPLSDLAPIVGEHHERFGGGGYPLGVDASSTSLLSRILTLADAFDAMTTNRSYRAAFCVEEAVERIEQCSGTQFDPDIVDAFLRSNAIDDCRNRHDGLSASLESNQVGADNFVRSGSAK